VLTILTRPWDPVPGKLQHHRLSLWKRAESHPIRPLTPTEMVPRCTQHRYFPLLLGQSWKSRPSEDFLAVAMEASELASPQSTAARVTTARVMAALGA